MSCLLCLSVECDENRIDVASAEGQRQNIASILYTHFPFCFQVSHFQIKFTVSPIRVNLIRTRTCRTSPLTGAFAKNAG